MMVTALNVLGDHERAAECGTDEFLSKPVNRGELITRVKRLLRVRHFLEGESMFMANYADALTDLPLDRHVEKFQNSNAVGCMVGVRTSQSFHSVQYDGDGWVTSMGRIKDTEFWINAGYFVFKPALFDYLQEGDELVEEP
jgi:glucose-1-phosphate cytidylyltransferase